MLQIDTIIKGAKEHLQSIDEQRVARAFDFAQRAHSTQKRFSGEPYIIHPLSVAEILLDFHPSENMLITALLHDVVEDTHYSLDDIEKHFGREVRDLCDGLVKLSKVKSNLDFNDMQTENLRKLFLAMAKDYRIVLLKLCDRLHNMRTLKFVRSEKQLRIARETLNIYAPIAARLGIYRLKSQMEDLCFMYLHPEDYRSIYGQLGKTDKIRDKYVDAVKDILTENLAQEGIQARVDGRVKSAYSIYRKLKKKNKNSIDEIFDIFAMRIILPDIYKYGQEYTGHLYTTLGILHKNFTPLANRFKDYVAVPKVNGYRSLHTTLMGLGVKAHTQPTEVQIRTESMHQGAEFGIAAHWLYKETNVLPQQDLEKKHLDWLAGLGKIENEIENNQELMENLKVDVFQDRIFVLTPRGDIKDLPLNATPVDFAYAVHTNIGNQCIGARVNGNIAPLDYELKSGEVVEIITRKNARPNQYWLSFVKTNHARNRIRGWFRDLDETKHLQEGKRLLNEKLLQLGKPLLDPSLSLLDNYDNKKIPVSARKDILIEIGKGVLMIGSVIRKVFTLAELMESKTSLDKINKITKPTEQEISDKKPELFIGNEKNMPYHFAKCCNADFKDELIGYITRGKGISVHKKLCRVVKNTEPNRLIGVSNQKQHSGIYYVYIMTHVEDRVGLIRDISDIIAKQFVNIVDFFQKYSEESYSEMGFLLRMESFDQLDQVLSRIEKIPSVLRAFKVN